jgi:lipopolysaccharide transport system ATP-binding protein
MKKTEIARKFDEIVAFAEVEKFIDTPVKRYSSGMYVRLAFAVAAHMETEILLVDEVLAVGDTQFQKKCLGKMDDVAKHGRTVLFVSHTMPSIQRLCSRCILLENGSVKLDAGVDRAIEEYLAGQNSSEYVASEAEDRPAITSADAAWTDEEGITVSVRFASPFPLKPPILGIVVHDALGGPVFGTNPLFDPDPNTPQAMQSGTIRMRIASESLRSDVYYISLWLGDPHETYCYLDRALRVEVGIGAEPCRPSRNVIGSVRLPTSWNYQQG